jgi:hypothetical protein
MRSRYRCSTKDKREEVLAALYAHSYSDAFPAVSADGRTRVVVHPDVYAGRVADLVVSGRSDCTTDSLAGALGSACYALSCSTRSATSWSMCCLRVGSCIQAPATASRAWPTGEQNPPRLLGHYRIPDELAG